MAVSFPLFNLIMNICMIIVYWVGGDMVFNGELGTGDIMAFSNYVMQILMSLMSSSFMFLFLSRAGVSIQRVNEVLDTKSDIADGAYTEAKVTEGKVEFRGQDLTKLPVFMRARRGLGYLAQEASIFRKLSVWDNVMAILHK